LIELEQAEKEKLINLCTKVNVFYKKENSYFFNSEFSEMASNYFSEDVITEIDPSRIYSHEKYVQTLLNQRELDLKTRYYPVIYLQENDSKIMINNVIILS
uniref:hypothetical protein n=1 Tax=Acinetobacter calcoaceticus TaxID=471 RepID=UPI00148EFBCB